MMKVVVASAAILVGLATVASAEQLCQRTSRTSVPTGCEVPGPASYELINGRVHAYKTAAGHDVRHTKRFFRDADRGSGGAIAGPGQANN